MKNFLFIFISICLSCSGFAASVDTLSVYSKAMNKQIKNVVILPDSYQESEQGYPVVYLLHGATGDFTNWVTKVPEVKAYADLHDMVIVCPDGGFTSWYFDSPIDPKMQYESYVSTELVAAVDKQYKTLAEPAGRAITGLSMGGHGGLFLGFRHQEVFGAAGSMSGGVDLRPFANNWDIRNRIGTQREFPNRWEELSVINLIHLLDNPDFRIIIDCGTSDFFYQINKALHKKLLARNIRHDYIERPGGHNWEYWENAVGYQLLFFHHFFQAKDN